MPDIAACSHCGSVRVYPKIWVGGFLATINDERQTYVCRDCNGEGMLLTFRTEEDRTRFTEERRSESAATPSKPRAQAIPILPLDAVPLVEVRGIDAIPIYRSKVVDARWTDRRLHRGEYRVDVEDYWDAVGGPRYNADRLFVLDLSGINHANPNFEALRGIAKRTSLLLDLGAREPEDVMDGYMVDAEAIVMGTKNVETLDAFREVYAISEGVIPCLDFADGVVWSDLSREDRDLRVAAAALHAIGFEELAVMDLRRLGTFSGPDIDLLQQVEGLDFDVYFGGGIREEDVARLREAGVVAGLVDPFTPVIRSLLSSESRPVPAEAIPATRPVRDVRGSPAPG